MSSSSSLSAYANPNKPPEPLLSRPLLLPEAATVPAAEAEAEVEAEAVAALGSRRAVLRCAPLQGLPQNLYEGGWDDFDMGFIPRQLG